MCFTTVSLVTLNIRGSSICSPKSLYKKTSQEILAELKAAFKTGESKVPKPQPILLSLLWQACVNSQLSPTPPSPPRGREKKNVTKMNFLSCSDHSPKWIINYCYIFVPYLRVWVFFFLRTSFFTAQHIGPMLYLEKGMNKITQLGLTFHWTNQPTNLKAFTTFLSIEWSHKKTFLCSVFFYRRSVSQETKNLKV